jgi:Tol biopolymer transport system component
VSPSVPSSLDASPSIPADLLPTGRGILFQAFPGTSGNTFSEESEIYLIDPDGTGLQRITNNTVADRFPRWSPDGTFFAFSRFDGLTGDILTIDTAGGEGSLTSGEDDDRSPEVARGFVYFNRRPGSGGTYDIWRVPVQGGDASRAVGRPNVDDLSPAWSPDGPDGMRLAFTSDRDDVAGRAIYITPPGGPAERFTTGENVDRNPRWHPTEDRIVFTRNSVEDGRRDIWSIDLATREATPITSDPADEGAPVYSPDGKRIAFYRSIDDVFHLVILDLESGVETDLTETRHLEGNSIDPSWR